MNWIVSGNVPPSLTLKEIQQATACDSVFKKLINGLETDTIDCVNESDLRQFKHVIGELSVKDGVVMRGSRIVIPTKLQKRVVEIAHEGHQGLVKTKQLLRSRIWFPDLDAKVASVINTCCQAVVPVNAQEPIKSTELPNGPWEKLAIDYYGPLPSGEYVLVVIDEYSRFPEIDVTTSMSAKATLPKRDRIISSFGIPVSIKSDNGPPFDSEAFKNYCRFMGIEHKPITPRHPQANGVAENFNRMVNKVVCTAAIERKSWKQELYKFLRNYRATPHLTTGKCPADLLFQKRPYRIRLPEQLVPVLCDKDFRQRDAQQKLKAKQYADRKVYVKKSTLVPGDVVLVRKMRRRENGAVL